MILSAVKDILPKMTIHTSYTHRHVDGNAGGVSDISSKSNTIYVNFVFKCKKTTEINAEFLKTFEAKQPPPKKKLE